MIESCMIKHGKQNLESPNPLSVAEPRVADNESLREPQREAYEAVCRHFQKTLDPALVQVPVGCGKSGLISLLPLGLSKKRALIVAPNLTIRDSLFRTVDSGHSDCFFLKHDVVPARVDGPFAAIIDGRSASLADCTGSHFVVTNIQQLGKNSRWLSELPYDFFDVVIFDEGHHNAAASWARLIEYFPDAKIISLTATPFRSDKKEVVGKLVYHYPLIKAMRRGYIKALQSIHIAPTELAFTFSDTYETATLADVMKLREETWFSRGVALADTCNRSIALASIQACEKLRKVSGCHQQIIAAACSTDHADAIAEIYRQLGYKAQSIHSGQNKRTRANTLKHLRNHNLDVIVQVQVLGEGFDHPPLAVAAVFRPFRSLSPYIQFIGRVMRVVRQHSTKAPENQGVVVSHIGLNTNHHWEDFRNLDTSDLGLLAGLVGGEIHSGQNQKSKGDGGDSNSSKTRFFRPDMLVEWERIDQKSISSDNFANSLKKHAIAASEPNTKSRRIAGPQQRRREAGSKLTTQVNEAVKSIVYPLKLYPNGKQVARYFPKFRHLNNWAALRFWIYMALNQKAGRRQSKSEKWTLAEVEDAIKSLPAVADEIREQISARQAGRKNCRPFAA